MSKKTRRSGVVPSRTLSGFERLLAEAGNAQAGRQHQALLAAGDGAVDAPLIHAEIDRTDGADAIDEQQRGMLGIIDGAPHGGDVAGDTRCRLVLHHHHRAYRMLAVGGECRMDMLRRGARAPRLFLHLDLETMAAREIDPQMAELAEARGQHTVAGAQRIGENRLPRAGAGRREDEHLTDGGLEDLLQVLEQRQSQLREQSAAVVLHRPVHGAENAVRHIGRARNMKEVTAWHGVSS